MRRGLLAGLALALLLGGCGTPDPKPGVYGPFEGKAPRMREARHPQGVRGMDPREEAPPAQGEYARESEETSGGKYEPEMESTAQAFASVEEVTAFSEGSEHDYRIGPGDVFDFVVRGRSDITREDVVVAPDGLVSLPRVGIFKIEGMTLNEATGYAEEKLRRYYEQPDVSLQLSVVNNNQVFVLGRVANPGAVHLSGRGTLLEALSLAGGLPADTRLSFLSRCMIVRGDSLLIWVDLRELLERGNLALNTRLQNGDFIYIPQSEDQLAYVMGEVHRPGVLVLRSQMTLLDAVMGKGGITINADRGKVYLIRSVDGKGHVEEVNMEDMVTKADFRKNYVLRDGDIVYVAPSGIGKFNTTVSQLIPGMAAVDFSINTLEAFGVMQELRNRIWGQEGFVNRTSSDINSE